MNGDDANHPRRDTMSSHANKMRSPFGQIQEHPAVQVVPSSWVLEQQIAKAMGDFAEDRKRALEERFERAVAFNRRTNGVRGALDHGCHPKPRDGGIDKFRF